MANAGQRAQSDAKYPKYPKLPDILDILDLRTTFSAENVDVLLPRQRMEGIPYRESRIRVSR